MSKAMSGVQYSMGLLLSEKCDWQRFSQIYQIDFLQKVLGLYIDVCIINLDTLILCHLWTLMKNYNPYSKAFKNCG